MPNLHSIKEGIPEIEQGRNTHSNIESKDKGQDISKK